MQQDTEEQRGDCREAGQGVNTGRSATSADAIRLIVLHRAERPVGLFILDGHPHLKLFAIDLPDLSAYGALTQIGA